MGYTTDFFGQISISPAMKPEHANYINKFSSTRRMKRNEKLTMKREDPLRIAANLPVGKEGSYFVGEKGDFGQPHPCERTKEILDYNCPPFDQPGLWCQWIVVPKNNLDTDEISEPTKMVLIWDGSEKFYNYVEWLQYLIDHFFSIWGYTLEGEIRWQGETASDFGFISVTENKIKVTNGKKGDNKNYLVIGISLENGLFVSSVMCQLKDKDDIKTATKIIEDHMKTKVERVLIIDTNNNNETFIANDFITEEDDEDQIDNDESIFNKENSKWFQLGPNHLKNPPAELI